MRFLTCDLQFTTQVAEFAPWAILRRLLIHVGNEFAGVLCLGRVTPCSYDYPEAGGTIKKAVNWNKSRSIAHRRTALTLKID
jgi:hypothetical protein